MTPPRPPVGEAKGETRAGFVALIGAPNAGKSTLLNAAVGSKLSIVTHKVQTTRALVRGIVIHGNAQLVFVDTPGIFAPKRRLDRAMVTTAWGGAADADVIALIIDAKRGLTDEDSAIIERLAEFPAGRTRVLILNKVDIVKRETLLALAKQANEAGSFARTFMISALTRDGVSDLLDFLAEAMPESPFLYPEDQMTDLPLRFLAAEITREKLTLRLHDELPYRSTVETEKWEETRTGVRIDQTIYVERESQRKIVLGKAGATIKAISMAAREEISRLAERPVHLFLFVKVREDWGDDPERYREMGVEFPKSEK
jgi:GTP-binding protein Era